MYGVAEFFWSLYLLWGILAGAVGWHFMQGSIITWKSSGGSFKNFLRETFAVPRCVLSMCVKDVRDILLIGELQPETAKDIPYTPGHLLKFFTALSFIGIAVIGILFKPQDVPVWVLLANSMAICISLAASLGHLYIRWMDRPRIWRWTVVGSIAWIIFIPFIGAAI